MNKNKSQILLNAAIAGMLGASFTFSQGGTAVAGEKDEKGSCMHSNSCKGKGECMSASNSCQGMNSCKGKGMMKMTQADCDAMAKKMKNKKVKWEKSSPMDGEKKSKE